MVRWSGVILICALVVFATAPANAVEITFARTEAGVDWVSAGVGGVGGGSGTITVVGISGTVTRAFLYWHGIDRTAFGGDGFYDNQSIVFNGTPIVGTSLGDSSTNCFGTGSSRAFLANVTSLVPGNGVFTLSGLSSGTGHSANGASLVVIFDDGNPSNNRDLVFFEGNDSDVPQGFPGDADGWAATLAGINYSGGPVNVQLHVGDGQDFGDDSILFSSDAPVSIPDSATLWDGLSVPNAGTSRVANGSLWDIHTFPITSAFTSSGPKTLNFSGMAASSDCHGLVLMLVDLQAGAAPVAAAPIPALSLTGLLAMAAALAAVAIMIAKRS